MKHRHHIFSLFFAVVLLLPLPVWATISSYTPTTSDQLKSSYYTNLEGKSGSTLFSAVVTATGGVKHTYTKLTYDELWTAYITSDVYPAGHAHAGKIWDMYANCYYATSEHVSQMKAECNGGYNREHSLPKSWFGGSSDYKSTNQGCDLVHLVPTDAYVNSDRSNYAFGEVGTVVKQFEISKRGTSVNTLSVSKSTISGTSVSTGAPTVFEPADDYKGDFARIYFYMRAHYPSLNLAQADGGTKHFSSTTSAASDSKYGLTDYSVILLMKWHRQDPVSQKEIDRNNAIEKMQGNRNPFVDYPCLAEYLWGEHAGETFSLSTAVGSFENGFTPGLSDGCACSTDPTLTVNPTSLTVDPVAVNGTSTKTFTVTGANLTGNITITKTSGSGYFTVSSSSIAAAIANGSNTITVTYRPTSTGDHTATFTIASTGATSQTVTVSGTCTTVYTATWMADGSPYHQNTAASGSAPSVPEAPSNCTSSRVFMGWTDNGSYSGDGSDLFTTTAPTITTDKTFYAVYADKETSGGGGSSSSASYTFSNKSWAASPSNWTSGKDGNGFSNSGVQVTTGVSGANATCPTSYNSISSIVISYCTNASKGAGSITMTVGSTSVSNNVSTTGGTTPRDLTFDFSSTKPSGAPQITVTCTTNSIYICGVTITYGGGGSTTYSNYSTQCTACTPVAATASYAYPTRTTTCGGSVSNTFTTNSNATVSYTSSNETVATVASDGTVTPVGAGTATITATVPANTCYTGGASASFTLTVNRTSTSASFVSPTTTVGVGSSVTNTVTTESDGTVTYSSDNTSVATVNSSGQVTGKVAGTATITANIAQSSCYNATSASYTITVEAAPEYTVTFMNMGDTHDTRTGTAGSAISAVSEPTACTGYGYTFEGWSTSQYAVDNTVTPSLSTPTTIPVGGVTYYAVYSKTEGSGSSAATAGTTLWSEDFSGYSANNVPSGTIASSHTGTTIYGNSTITYACDNGGGTTKIYAAKLAGGTSPEILIAKSNGSFSISGIPTGSAETMTLLFNTNKSGSPSNFSITSGTSGISIGSLSSPAANQLSCSITNANGVTTFDLTIAYTSSQNSREDNFLLTVATAGSGSSTTYHTTAPDCSCTATITATSNDDSMGTVSVATP